MKVTQIYQEQINVSLQKYSNNVFFFTIILLTIFFIIKFLFPLYFISEDIVYEKLEDMKDNMETEKQIINNKDIGQIKVLIDTNNFNKNKSFNDYTIHMSEIYKNHKNEVIDKFLFSIKYKTNINFKNISYSNPFSSYISDTNIINMINNPFLIKVLSLLNQ